MRDNMERGIVLIIKNIYLFFPKAKNIYLFISRKKRFLFSLVWKELKLDKLFSSVKAIGRRI